MKPIKFISYDKTNGHSFILTCRWSRRHGWSCEISPWILFSSPPLISSSTQHLPFFHLFPPPDERCRPPKSPTASAANWKNVIPTSTSPCVFGETQLRHSPVVWMLSPFLRAAETGLRCHGSRSRSLSRISWGEEEGWDGWKLSWTRAWRCLLYLETDTESEGDLGLFMAKWVRCTVFDYLHFGHNFMSCSFYSPYFLCRCLLLIAIVIVG